MEKDDANNQRMRNFFVTFDEAAINGDKFRAVLLGKLDNDRVHKPFLVRHDKGFRTPTAVSFHQNNDNFDQTGTRWRNSELFVTDSASYNYVAAQMLKEGFCKMQHVTCFSHILARVAREIVEKVVSNRWLKVWTKSKNAIRQHAWELFRVPEIWPILIQQKVDGAPIWKQPSS